MIITVWVRPYVFHIDNARFGECFVGKRQVLTPVL
jgi:hypothetical protein